MRLVGLLLMFAGAGIIWELYYKGRTLPEAVANVAATFGLRQLAAGGGFAPAGVSAATNASQSTAGTLRPGQPS